MSGTYNFVRNGLEDTYGILKLQDKILEIMVDLDRFCSENNITYFLMGGSALGAVRHQGFIPWDDDLDIFMPYKDYVRFIKLCETKLDKKKYYLQVEDSDELPYFFSKVRMNGTTFIDEVNLNRGNVHKGIYVDVMCLNNAAPKGLRRYIQYKIATLLRASSFTKLPEYRATGKKAFAIWLAKLLVHGSVKKFFLKTVRKYNNRQTEDVAHVFGRAKFKNAYYPSFLFNNQRYVQFEQVKLAVPNGVEEYLSIRYGQDYMKMPSEEVKASYKAHCAKWDTEVDYRNYLENNDGLKDCVCKEKARDIQH